jgi:Holliday junction DNA helicase RuvA
VIGRLKGEVIDKGMENLVLDVNGVGYDVVCPLTVLESIPPLGQVTSLAIHTHVREDQITLFGFTDSTQRTLFRQLISISGVGPKIGLACLSGMDAETLAGSIGAGDVKRLCTIPGLGKRTSERIVLELREKVGGLAAAVPKRGDALNDLESALKNLGYKAKDVDKLIQDLSPTAGSMSFEELLRQALQRLRPK